MAEWAGLLIDAYGDPAAAVCQTFFRWKQRPVPSDHADDLCWEYEGGADGGDILLWTGGKMPLRVRISREGPEFDAGGELSAFAVFNICSGLWYLAPSLNVPGVLHSFVVLYDVPDPAPWERRVVLAEAIA
jgi:hypothetical protein